jgi:hypothetical protein
MPNVKLRGYKAQRIWRLAHGVGAFPCYFCGTDVHVVAHRSSLRTAPGKPRFAMHHINENHYDDRLENIAIAHHTCHMSHHNTDRDAHWAKPCEPGCTCNRHKDYSSRRTYTSWRLVDGKRVYDA